MDFYNEVGKMEIFRDYFGGGKSEPKKPLIEHPTSR